ncbi:MAG TPA: hypothetical protein VLZ83_05190 [Edaphocola sp.]|nr:hypothetical protein [Edaphocola sp.]
MIRLIGILFLIFSLEQSYAQGIFSLDYKLNKAVKLYNKGEVKKADILINKLVLKHPFDRNLYSKVGEFYYDLGRFQDAVYYFDRGSKMIKNGVEIYSIPLAKSWLRAGAPERANLALRQFPFNLNTPSELKEDIDQLQQSINFSKLISYNTYPISVQNLGVFINSEFDDFAPSFSALSNDLVFTRKVNGIDENFFISHLDTCQLWSMAEDMGFPLNSNLPESYQNRAYSDKYMIYQKCGNRSVNGWERGGCDLYLSYAQKDKWSEPKPFGYTINTTVFEGMPCLDPSETALYFSSNRPGGYGGMDIWVSYFENGRWQEPVNLGPNINTNRDEIAPVMAADGKTFFFASNGWPGFGGFDIFNSKINVDSSFDKNKNIGTPINSTYDDLPGTASLDGNYMFMASDRIGGYGGMDIYKAEIPSVFAPKPMTLIYGVLFNQSDSSRIKNAPLSIVDLNNDGRAYPLTSNRGDGSFYICLPKDEQFEVFIEPNFYKEKRTEFTVNKTKDVDTLSFYLERKNFEIAKFSAVLGAYHIPSFSEKKDADVRDFVIENLRTVKGTISKIFLHSYFQKSDIEKVEQLKSVFLQILYEMGYNDEQIVFFDNGYSSKVDFNKLGKNKKNKMIIEVDYTN